MTDYSQNTNFTAKDSLPTGDPEKIIMGSDLDAEFSEIQTAIATKANSANAALTGTTTVEAISITGNETHTGTETHQGASNYVTASGTDTYTATLSPAITAYTEGAEYKLKFSNANTSTTPTLNLNSIGAKTIIRSDGNALSVGELASNGQYTLRYDGTNLRLIGAATPTHASVRQTVLSSALSSGVANAISAGTGLRINLAATTTPIVLSYAAGFDGGGALDYIEQISVDDTDMTGSDLGYSNKNYIYRGRLDAWYSTLIPPQYGYTYDRTKNALLHFEGADASTSMIDDYGNTWTASGNAQIDTAQFKFGASSLLLDGTGDYVASTDFKTFGNGGWTVEGFCRFNTVPTAGNSMFLFDAGNASNWGAGLRFTNSGGTHQLQIYLSSNGTSYDISSGDAGNTGTATTGVWYHWALTYDPVAGYYYAYWNGTKVIQVASTSRICAVTNFKIGSPASAASSLFDGWIDEFRLSPCCRYPAGTTFTPSASAFSVEGHYFSIPEMKMYEVTSASASAGTDPGMTARQRVFVGEAVTGASSVSSVVNYALRGRYDSGLFAVANANEYEKSHNLGVAAFRTRVTYTDDARHLSERPAQPHFDAGGYTIGWYFKGTTNASSRLNIRIKTSNTYVSWDDSGNAKTSGYYRLVCERGW